MSVSRSNPIAGAVGVCLLTVPVLCLRWPQPEPAWPASLRRRLPPPPATPSEAVRRAARWNWVRAEQAVNRERELLEAWDPATEDLNQEKWRQQLMAADPHGELKQALKLARRAAALARRPADSYAAAQLLARLECDAGHHEAELEQARKLMAMRPGSQYSLITLQHAAICNHLEPLTRRAAAALRKLEAPAFSDPGPCQE